MAGYIKSHSNYRLQTRHQIVNDGVIYERDISTVGGVNSFATGQSTIYQSGNFVIVVNNGASASRNIRKGAWLASGDDNDTWNEEILSQHSSDINGSVEKTIMLKNDFMDLRSFAYYGSLSDLIENTVLKIVSTYPYELYYGDDLEDVELSKDESVEVSLTDFVLISGTTYQYAYVTLQPHQKITLIDEKYKFILGLPYIPTIYDGDTYESGDEVATIALGQVFDATNRTIPYVLSERLKISSNPGNIDMHNINAGGSSSDDGLGHFYNGGYTNYELIIDNEVVGFKWSSTPIIMGKVCPKPWEIFSIIRIQPNNGSEDIMLYACWNDRLDIVYLTSYSKQFHIRPKSDGSYYDDFVDGLDLFGKCLIGLYSGIKNTAKFEVLSETETGTRKDVRVFTIPSGPGGYNIYPDSFSMKTYISELGKIGIRYDEVYSDNFLRMMTHDSLKNLDWTNGFNGNEGYGNENEYIKTGEKFSSIIRVMGYTFDQEKAYIDSIGNVNTVTYSNRDNLSDYFLTDALETDGINVNTVYPYDLTEYNSSGDTVPESEWTEDNQTENEYSRKFSENTAEIIYPYEHFGGAFYSKCVDGKQELIEIEDYTGQEFHVDDGKVYNVLTEYHNDTEVTIPDVNNEFMKRLKINSKNLLRKKGTIDGIESMLSMFGMKSKRWSDEGYDFDISETTYFARPIIDEPDLVHGMDRIDWYNSCKTIPYDTPSYLNGDYIPYQGLPVAYREIGNKRRKLYPFFQQDGIYDGDMYYQMNGGWIGYLPCSFDIEDKFLLSYDGYKRVETMRNVMQVNNMTELINLPLGDLYDNAIYYVTDTSELFALINGYPYPINMETVSGETKYYFEEEINGGSVSIGGDLYEGVISVRGRNGEMVDVDLSLYEDGTALRVYYYEGEDKAFKILSDTYGPVTSLMFSGGTYDASNKYTSHYFILKDVNFAGLIGEGFWQEISSDSYLYQEIENITDVTIGNNPHSGNFSYDNGEEYLNRYRNIFKYASENRYFNESCFTNVDDAYEEIDEFGFNLEKFKDSKSHSFCDVIEGYSVMIPKDNVVSLSGDIECGSDTGCTLSVESGGTEYYYNSIMVEPNRTIVLNTGNSTIAISGETEWIVSGDTFTCDDSETEVMLMTTDHSKRLISYQYTDIIEHDIDSAKSIYSIEDYSEVEDIEGADGVTSQIINTKNVDLRFYLHFENIYEKGAQEEIKYIQCKIMPYVEQMIPSTTIMNVHFVTKERQGNRIFDYTFDNTFN